VYSAVILHIYIYIYQDNKSERLEMRLIEALVQNEVIMMNTGERRKKGKRRLKRTRKEKRKEKRKRKRMEKRKDKSSMTSMGMMLLTMDLHLLMNLRRNLLRRCKLPRSVRTYTTTISLMECLTCNKRPKLLLNQCQDQWC